MAEQRRINYAAVIYYILAFLVSFAITYTTLIPIRIANATPTPLIALVIAYSYFYGETRGFTVGLIVGIFADGVAADTVGFNAIMLAVIGMLAGALVKKYLNKNIYSAVFLSVIGSGVYHFAKWLVFYAFSGIQGIGNYLMMYILPSAVYSALFIIPFYFLGKLFIKKREI